MNITGILIVLGLFASLVLSIWGLVKKRPSLPCALAGLVVLTCSIPAGLHAWGESQSILWTAIYLLTAVVGGASFLRQIILARKGSGAPLIMQAICLLLIPMTAFGGIISCKGWQMDYGKPAAQFHQESLLEKGKPYIGRKITVKGKVERVDTSNPKAAWVYLDGGIRCNFEDFAIMAKSNKVGETVYVDGFLRSCEPGDILIKPALNRDPKAPFSPQ